MATPEIPVVAAVVTSKDVPIYLRGVGTVIAYNTDVVRSQIQGQITQITFVEGQTVKAGDLLAQIDPRPYQAQIEQLTADLDRDKAQLTNAEAICRAIPASGIKVTPRRSWSRRRRPRSTSCRPPSRRTRR